MCLLVGVVGAHGLRISGEVDVAPPVDDALGFVGSPVILPDQQIVLNDVQKRRLADVVMSLHLCAEAKACFMHMLIELAIRYDLFFL